MSLSDQPPKPKGRIHSIFADGRDISGVGSTNSGSFLRTNSGTFVVTTGTSGRPQYAFQPADTAVSCPPRVTIINGVVHYGELPKILDDLKRTQLLERLAESVLITRASKVSSLNPLFIAAISYVFYLGIASTFSSLKYGFYAFVLLSVLAYEVLERLPSYSSDAIYA